MNVEISFQIRKQMIAIRHPLQSNVLDTFWGQPFDLTAKIPTLQIRITGFKSQLCSWLPVYAYTGKRQVAEILLPKEDLDLAPNCQYQ